MNKIITVVGARPQFIKAAVLSRVFAESYSNTIKEVIVHTGQHYDKNMSDIFFKEMEIPEPDYNLNVGSGSHGKMTGRMLEGIESVVLKEKPSLVLVYGDTNSTLAGALAASKLHIPVAHVEAGLRSFNMHMPEEQNRILTDHLSSILFCPTAASVENLAAAGIHSGIFRTGDVMYDASLFYSKKQAVVIENLPDKYLLMTLHRAENTDNPNNLGKIVKAVNSLKEFIFILPLHPRTRKMLSDNNLEFDSNVKIIDPVGYFDMLHLESNCEAILTDSGGVQKEAYFFNKPCITLREQTEWIETVDAGWNILAGADYKKIVKAVKGLTVPGMHPDLYGDGNAGRKIAYEIEQYLKMEQIKNEKRNT